MKGYVLIFSVLLTSIVATAYASYNASPSCMRSLEENFFDNTTVSQALSLHRVDTGSWTPIYEDLVYYSKDIHRIIEQEAKRQNPNPLYNPFDPEKAEKLLLNALYTVFYNTLTYHQVTNVNDIQEMFSYVVEHNRPRLETCFKKRQKHTRH